MEIVEPRFGDRLAALAISDQAVRLRVEKISAGDRVLVSLDGRRPRVLPEAGVLRLGQLLPEDEIIAEGAHVLVAAAVDRDGLALRARAPGIAAFSIVDFAVGEHPAAPSAKVLPRLFCLAPSGTFHGAEADRLVLSLLVVGPAKAKLPLSIAGAGVEFSSAVDPALPHAISGLPSGDLRFSVSLSATERAECVATLNRDGAEPVPR